MSYGNGEEGMKRLYSYCLCWGDGVLGSGVGFSLFFIIHLSLFRLSVESPLCFLGWFLFFVCVFVCLLKLSSQRHVGSSGVSFATARTTQACGRCIIVEYDRYKYVYS